jgi:large subunit ribosomal protein L4
MPKIDVTNTAGAKVGSIDLDDAVWAADINEHLLWEAVKWQRAKRRSGTHSTKTVAMVRGTGKKPYKQKGTGNARRGSERSHHMVGGGRAFGPKPRDYEYSMPKKAKKGALRSALSLRVKEQKLIILDQFAIAPAAGEKKQLTKQVAAALATMGAQKALIVDGKDNANLARGAKNLVKTKWIAPEGVNVYDVLDHETLIITREAAEKLSAALKPTAKKAAAGSK